MVIFVPGTVKVAALTPVPPAVVTATVPDEAPTGTGIDNCVADRTVHPELTLNVPKRSDVAPARSVPVMVTTVPTPPDVGLKPWIRGALAVLDTEKVGLEADPFGVVTTIGPLLAPAGTDATTEVLERTVNSAAVPPKVTFVACARPVPTIVTDVPTPPDVGAMLVTATGGVVMTNVTVFDPAA